MCGKNCIFDQNCIFCEKLDLLQKLDLFIIITMEIKCIKTTNVVKGSLKNIFKVELLQSIKKFSKN